MLFLDKKIRIRIMLILLLFYGCLAFAIYQLPDNLFHIYFLNVDQGDSIFIKTPNNHQILIDGGPKNLVIEELTKVMPFFDKSIDLVVLTHPHADHLDGLIEVLKRFKVSAVLMTGIDYKSPNYDEFLNEIDKQGVEIFIAESISDFKFGSVLLDVIYPKNQMIGMGIANVNNSSIAIKLNYKDKKILLVGDLEKEIEKELVAANLDLSAQILKAGHHGSKTASTPEFLKRVAPEIVVIQLGKNNSYGHPHEEALENMKQSGVKSILRTDIEGQIEFTF